MFWSERTLVLPGPSRLMISPGRGFCFACGWFAYGVYQSLNCLAAAVRGMLRVPNEIRGTGHFQVTRACSESVSWHTNHGRADQLSLK